MNIEDLPKIDSKQGEIHKPPLPVKPYQQKTSSPCSYYSQKHQRCGRYSLELKVKQQKDQKKSQRKYKSKCLLRAHLILVTSGKLIGNPCRQFQFSGINFTFNIGLSGFHNIHFSILRLFVKKNITGKKCLLPLYHVRPAPV